MPHVSRETASPAATLAVPALVEMTAMMAACGVLTILYCTVLHCIVLHACTFKRGRTSFKTRTHTGAQRRTHEQDAHTHRCPFALCPGVLWHSGYVSFSAQAKCPWMVIWKIQRMVLSHLKMWFLPRQNVKLQPILQLLLLM